MKIPLSWLREYVEIRLTVPQLAERLTLAGLEVSGVRMVGLPSPEGCPIRTEDQGPVWDRDKVFIARVLEVQRHPDADRLTLVTLDYGREPKQVVTGASNIRVGDQGQKVILALSGSVLLDGHAEGKVFKQLKPTKIRGVPSDAMVCSARELGLADEHEGIILLEDDAPVGMPLADFMGDAVLEVDVLPNMARCLSMLGIAREVAALTGAALRTPVPHVRHSGMPLAGQVGVEIENPDLCRRYAAALIRNVKQGASPGWMQRRLSLAGMRPLGNVVDVTNYVMLEWGQPLHAFDFDRLVERSGGKPPTIRIRPAREGETLRTLDGVERKLASEQLLIADTAGPIALAGVMGGADTEVQDSTRNILLESASFDFISIRRTARQLDLPSEASLRFSRGVHPALVQPAAERAAELLQQLAAGEVAQGLVDCCPRPLPPQVVRLPMAEIPRLLGVEIPKGEAVGILRSLEFQVEDQGEVLQVTVPPHRLDIQHGPADLIEELARIRGYDRLPATLLCDRLPEQRDNPEAAFEDRLKDALVTLGLQEVMNYALTTPEREQPFEPEPPREYVRLANPISRERTVMRHSVVASVLDNAALNLRNFDRVRLFELGYIYLPRPGERLPEEPRRLAIVQAGGRGPESWCEPGPPPGLDFFDLKGVIQGLLAALHAEEAEYQPSRRSYLHPGRSAEAVLGKTPLGWLGQLHPGLNARYDLGRREVWVAELDVDALERAVPDRHRFVPILEYPPVRQDIAIVVDESMPAAKVAAEIRAAGGQMLKGVRLFDVYRGPNLPPGKKSLAYALTYQAEDKTLTDKDAAKVHGRIVARLEKILGAKLRA